MLQKVIKYMNHISTALGYFVFNNNKQKSPRMNTEHVAAEFVG